MDKDKIEPLLFTAWLRELNRTLLADKLGAGFGEYWSLRPEVILTILGTRTDWCDDRTTTTVETRPEQLAASLQRAFEQLEHTYGTTMDDWRWGRAHVAQFNHPVLSRVAVLSRLFQLEIPADGGSDTINRGGIFVRDGIAPYADVLGPGMRMVIDMADPAQA